MKLQSILILLILILVSVGINKGHEADDSFHVFDLDSSNIDRYLTAGGSWVLKFYAPWCKHSIQFQDTFEQLAKMLKGHVNFGQIDCVNDPALLYRFGIKAYPTVKLLHQGKLYEFQGERSVNNIVQFLQSDYLESSVMAYPELPAEYEKVEQAPEEIHEEQTELTEEQKVYIEQQRQEMLVRQQQLREQYLKEEEEMQKQKQEKKQERLAKKLKNPKTKKEYEDEVPKYKLDVGEHSIKNGTLPIIETLRESKVVYIAIGGMLTAFILMAKKRLTKKSKFMKIA
ncbi:thioredoxin-like protein [Tieghemostelium lacteum]|uniref:Thioredoxin-like protein n=1 Tax=Tieghemostelium lacteum TaxID=361077 RepID=A0A151ZG83_TIELA|nr:thioredoxin-like protein [Tieghemostelium lacteum]|eukprot:KYQ92981.1 thioredoxin-like protein [Tieghemostelium lacteum]